MAVDTGGLEQAVRDYSRDKTQRIAESFVEVARGFAPRRTGAGADSITVESVEDDGDRFVAHVTVGEPYMRYQDEGTGIYGPNGTPIRPTSGNVLVFDSAILGGIVFARSVRGTEPTHWWARTIDAWPQIVGAA